MKRLVALVILTLSLSVVAKAQSPGPFYRQFFFNPYLFNPAFVASNNRPEANLVYRQQWTNFKDAPVTAGFNMQMPTHDRVALGFNIMTDKQVLVRNSSFMATFGYILPIADNQTLRFGLSGGVGMNRLDLNAEEVNANDPILMNASGSNFYVDGNFGLAYTFAGLRVGVALTDLFNSKSFNPESFNKFQMSNLRNRYFSASYRFDLDMMGTLSLEPMAMYRQSQDGLQDAWEVATVLYYQDKLWTGAGYNQNKGLAMYFGMNVKDKFRFSYSYEFPPFTDGFSSSSSHELHLSMYFNTKKSLALAKKKTSHTYSRRLVQKSFSKKFFATKQPQRKHPDLANSKKVENDQISPKVRVQDDTVSLAQRNQNPENLMEHQAKYLMGDEVDENSSDAVRIDGGEGTTPSNSTGKLKKSDVNLKAIEREAAKNKGTENKTEEKATAGVKTKESFTMSQGRFYVVVGVFRELNGSVKYSREVSENGFPVNVALNPKNNLYYVYIQSSLDIDEAKKVRNDYRKKNLFKEAWVYSLDEIY